ncbi:hypothetical protein TCAL_15040 [Tigriopus californicus]|uniref:Uncharacterized protein n=1 Tax=Tigriopus californicus TaxID=6832 RepID=A0A553NYY1_TIGCA|nr:hypothetical protein TCAL_15040 [Tigriopus californicus]
MTDDVGGKSHKEDEVHCRALRSLVLELQATRELLVSSLNKVQDLELENRKVPLLEKKVTLLEKTRKSESSTSNQLRSILTHLRPLSTMDSGLYSTSDSDEQCSPRAQDKSIDACSDEELPVPAHSPTSDQGRPPRPPSSVKLGTKSSRSNTPFSDKSSGKRPQTPSSSGHYSAGSPSSKKSPSQSTTHKEIIRRHDEKNDISTDVQVLEAQRVRLTLLEEKIKEVLNMLRTLNSMNISSKTLGMLVLDSVERSIDPLSGEIQVFKFLNHLYNSARDYERLSTESQIHNALRAVEAHTQTLADIEAAQSSQRQLALDANHYQVPRRIGRGDPFATIDV